MIYYVTVHWKSDRWIEFQSAMIRKHTAGDYRVFGWLTDIDDKWDAHFDKVLRSEDDISHAEKLDELARVVVTESTDDGDWIIFIDGDAFPVAPVDRKLSDYLSDAPLCAVQRLENSGDIQPHPCFCATTVGFWKRYPFTWKEGYAWLDEGGNPMTDVGAGMLKVMDEHKIAWKKLHRSNQLDVHPLLFGIYDDMVYHHGAGFREDRLVRKDYNDKVRSVHRLDVRILMHLTPRKYRNRVRRSFLHPHFRKERRVLREVNTLSQEVFDKLTADPDAFLRSLTGKVISGN